MPITYTALLRNSPRIDREKKNFNALFNDVEEINSCVNPTFLGGYAKGCCVYKRVVRDYHITT